MKYFSSDLGYSGYDDVSKFLSKYSQRDDVLFIASSNGDPRVIEILKSLDILQHFHKVYLSYDIEVSKPNKEFFEYILDDLMKNVEVLQNSSREEIFESIWHIGDELENDLEASGKAGWKSILIDRQNQFEELINKKDDESLAKIKLNTTLQTTNSIHDKVIKLDEKRFVVNNFDQISKIIGLDE
ncbi:hypothetical protein BN7_5644 [Wickerhamomyces ciferrii]|uniref:Uncharacterized protein n=1 Tax=Wickerhamomyces ciferrii (strain ATCC 14091 / BCRC 22168 / CBS 111 / JCM 3599 / NBRC 0793 / NRRL Y-1031 F-60-10) TaxID=1206466 RepID=K0KSA9_WICCF|nr:uncharacterized protein BN7_5644 [Wickerhamomyces ciferrii]CCH46056.1 hypothetical protein BN7_5644 [Wickerhamomyces ciferrii]